jgi:hypothetical protein
MILVNNSKKKRAEGLRLKDGRVLSFELGDNPISILELESISNVSKSIFFKFLEDGTFTVFDKQDLKRKNINAEIIKKLTQQNDIKPPKNNVKSNKNASK